MRLTSFYKGVDVSADCHCFRVARDFETNGFLVALRQIKRPLQKFRVVPKRCKADRKRTSCEECVEISTCLPWFSKENKRVN